MAANFAAAAGLAVVKSKTGRNLLIGVLLTILVVPVAVVALPVSMIFMMSGDPANARTMSGGCIGSTPTVTVGQQIGFYGQAQLEIAARIITVGQSENVDVHGQTVAVMVAMGESSLQNLDHGDAVDNTTIGVFQQGASYGTVAARMDVATAAAAFYTRMLAATGWETMDPGAVGHTVQKNQDPAHYTPYFAPATTVVDTLVGTKNGVCPVPADAKAAATALVLAINSGKLTFLQNEYRQQVINMADGTATPECMLDVHVLQIMVIAVNNFQQVGVSDLNRRCTGETPGAGTSSQHWKGKGVDFYALNYRSLHGSDAFSVQLIQLLDSSVPRGSGLGQSQCRAAAGDPISGLKNFTVEFADTCNHQHVQVP